MLRQFHSELGEEQKFDNTARYNGFIGKWCVTTRNELKGRGIKYFDTTTDGKTKYYLTPKAFENLCVKMDIDQELLFD